PADRPRARPHFFTLSFPAEVSITATLHHPMKREIMRFTTRNARLAGAAVALSLTIGLAACSAEPAVEEGSSEGLGTIKVGALETPAGDILKFVAENLSADAGLTIEFVPFTDYTTPNLALSDGSVDANLFQNSTFLRNYNEQ